MSEKRNEQHRQKTKVLKQAQVKWQDQKKVNRHKGISRNFDNNSKQPIR